MISVALRALAHGLAGLSIVFTASYAKRFNNEYLEFELPIGWECRKEGTEYVCQSTNSKRQKEAIIILAAKKRGEGDSLEKYEAHLRKAKSFTPPGGVPQISEPKTVKMNSINGHRWVDALHLASEVPGFYTRYLATVKADIGVAVTFSVAKDFYSSYQNVFDKVIQTLRVFRDSTSKLRNIRMVEGQGSRPGSGEFVSEGSLFDMNSGAPKQQSAEVSAEEGGVGILVLLLVLVVLIVIIRKRKNKS